MFDLPDARGDIFPYDWRMLEAMAAEGPKCRRKGEKCGSMHFPCCRIDPDKKEMLSCQYPAGSENSDAYVQGTCGVRPASETERFKQMKMV